MVELPTEVIPNACCHGQFTTLVYSVKVAHLSPADHNKTWLLYTPSHLKTDSHNYRTSQMPKVWWRKRSVCQRHDHSFLHVNIRSNDHSYFNFLWRLLFVSLFCPKVPCIMFSRRTRWLRHKYLYQILCHVLNWQTYIKFVIALLLK